MVNRNQTTSNVPYVIAFHYKWMDIFLTCIIGFYFSVHWLWEKNVCRVIWCLSDVDQMVTQTQVNNQHDGVVHRLSLYLLSAYSSSSFLCHLNCLWFSLSLSVGLSVPLFLLPLFITFSFDEFPMSFCPRSLSENLGYVRDDLGRSIEVP